MSGYIKLHRKIRQTPVLQKNSIARLFFVELLLDAAWADTVQEWRTKSYPVKRGQLIKSLRSMAEDYNLSVQQVRTLLHTLARAEMIKINTLGKTGPTLLTICNYEKYQGESQEDGIAANTHPPENQNARQHAEQQTKEEVKEYNNKKINILSRAHTREGQGDQKGGADGLGEHLSVVRQADGTPLLLNGTHQHYFAEFGSEQSLTNALHEAAGKIVTKDPIQFQRAMLGELGRIARLRADRASDRASRQATTKRAVL
ncbi:MAG: hypothetical protein ACR2PG_06335 [Hyphomicrobiaceae bacterium]